MASTSTTQRIAARLKAQLFPAHGDLRRVRFREGDRWLVAMVPDDECFGLIRELMLQRIYEPPGGYPAGAVVDAGAHVGLFTLFAAQHADRVVAIEPDPVNFRVLGLNRELNRLENVELRNRAVWTEETEMGFATSWHTTGGRLGANGDRMVQTVTLDSLVEELGEIAMLKLDIEGAELTALPAAGRLDAVQRMIAELHLADPGDELPAVAALESAGFDVEIVPAASLYRPTHLRSVLRNWRSVEGQLLVKLAVVGYLLAPIAKPRRPPGSRDMPLLVATRR